MLSSWALQIAAFIWTTLRPDLGESPVITLPDTFKPTHYNITIAVDLDSKSFRGAELVSIVNTRSSEELVINAGCNLVIDSLQVCLPKTKCRTATFSRSCGAGTLTVHDLDSFHIRPGDHFELLVGFSGDLGPSSATKLIEDRGFDQPGWSALKTFVPFSTRNSFPCFDAPTGKANFSLTLISRHSQHGRPTNITAFSNTDAVRQTPLFPNTTLSALERMVVKELDMDGSWVISEFQTTPKLSESNLAWGVGRYNHIESSYRQSNRRNVTTKVYANQVRLSNEQFALEVIGSSAKLSEAILDLELPLSTLAFAVTPGEAGAGEHFGLVVAASGVMTLSNQTDGQQKSLITATVAHEVIHQWFGALISPRTVGESWFEEGFASWMGDDVVGPLLLKDHQIWIPFLDKHLEPAMAADAGSSHSLVVPISEASDFIQVLDTVTYDKGSSVLRMTAELFGRERFMRIISLWVKRFEYEYVSEIDLWKALDTHVPDFDAVGYGRTWTRQPGFPVVIVDTLSEGSYHLKQERFFANGSSGDNGQLWAIPLFVEDLNIVMDKVDTIVVSTSLEQLLLNRGRKGFYRVLYDAPGRRWIKQHFNPRSSYLTGIERAGYLYDMIAFAKSGRVGTVEVLDLLVQMEKETDASVWAAATNHIIDLDNLLWRQSKEVQSELRAFALDLVLAKCDELGLQPVEEETAIEGKFRQVMLPVCGRLGVPSFVQEALRLLPDIGASNTLNLPETSIKIIMETAVRFGSARQQEYVMNIWNTDRLGLRSQSALRALAQSQDDNFVASLLEQLRTGQLVDNSASLWWMIGYLMSNKSARQLTFEWVQRHFKLVMAEATDTWRSWVFATLFSALTGWSDMDDIRKLLHSHPKWYKDLIPALESIEASAAWLDRDGESIEQWLQTRDPDCNRLTLWMPLYSMFLFLGRSHQPRTILSRPHFAQPVALEASNVFPTHERFAYTFLCTRYIGW